MLVLLIIMVLSIGIPNYLDYRRRGGAPREVNDNMRDAAEDLLADERDEVVLNRRRRDTSGLN